MITNGSKTRVSLAPPHELNVRKFTESRASELESLHSIVSNRLNNDFRSQRNKRKRTTGHDDRVGKKRFRKRGKNGTGDKSNDGSLIKDDRKISRRVRRSIEFKKNLPTAFGTSGDGTKRLRTHVWYAKRFTMIKLWGFHIPLGLHGRGRGSRSLLKKLKSGVLIHDASYHGAVQLEGPQEKLFEILCAVLVPSPSALSESLSGDVLAGGIFGSAMLHHTGNPFFHIAPVTYMWRPVQQITTNTETISIDFQQSLDDRVDSRQLWVWIHSAAFKEAYDTLISACEMQTDMSGGSVQCISLEGQLGKLELVGSKTLELLQKTLFPVHCTSESSSNLKKCSANEDDDHGETENTAIHKNCNKISSSSVTPFTVIDPRILDKKKNVVIPEESPHGLLNSDQLETKEQAPISSFPKHDFECGVGYTDLWDASKRLCPPLEESVVCMEKHNQRKDFVRIGSKTSVTQSASVEGKYSRCCPVLLLKNGNHEDSVIRCSIILPLSWIKVFWLTFISNGGHAIGLREKQWVSCEIGLPYFPLDFPDCNAYSHTMAMEKVVSDQKTSLLPPSKRPPEIPIPSPWNCVQLYFEKQSSENGNSHEHISDGCETVNLGKNSDIGKSNIKLFDCLNVPFEGFVGRTSNMLSDFLKTIYGNNLLLFPRVLDQKNCLYKLMKDREFLKEVVVRPEVNNGQARCFLRVFLHAYKEGVFEEGAVVCAPRFDDILLWTRSENVDQQLHISESLMRSYFMQLVSGKWKLQIPEDPAVQESFRWPIGFVTTGFIRGSKKPTALGLCEASLLSRLRVEQWKTFPVRKRRKEIYVLVRNPRSIAYKLALTTIVLEQAEEDVNFM